MRCRSENRPFSTHNTTLLQLMWSESYISDTGSACNASDEIRSEIVWDIEAIYSSNTHSYLVHRPSFWCYKTTCGWWKTGSSITGRWPLSHVAITRFTNDLATFRGSDSYFRQTGRHQTSNFWFIKSEKIDDGEVAPKCIIYDVHSILGVQFFWENFYHYMVVCGT